MSNNALFLDSSDSWSVSRPALLVLAVFSCIVIVGYVAHDPWRDELQAWNMARDMSLLDLIRNAGNEGHPIGWHVLIKPLSMLALPFESLQIMNLIFALAAVFLYFKYAPFSPWFKTLLVCTAPFVFVLLNARVYSLIAFLMMLQSCLHSSRLRSPWPYAISLAVLANTVVLCFPYVLLSAWLWIKSARAAHLKNVVLPAFCFLCAAFFGAVIQIIPSIAKIESIIKSRFSIINNLLSSFDTGFIFLIIFFVIIFIFFARFLWSFSNNFSLLIIFSFLFFFCIHLFVYSLSLYHIVVFAFIIHASVWIFWNDIEISLLRKKFLTLKYMYCILNIFALFSSAHMLYIEVTQDNSNVTKAVPFVRKYLSQLPVAGHSMSKVSSLSALLPGMKIWNPVTQEWGSFAVFDERWQRSRHTPMDEVVAAIFEQCDAFRPVLILSERWSTPLSHEYRLVFVADSETVYGEDFFIYVPVEQVIPGMPILPDMVTTS